MTVSIWLILLAVFAYGLFHSVLASLEVKDSIRKLAGPGADSWYRLAFNLIAVITLFPLLALPALLPDREIYTIPFPWLLLSSAIQVLAIIILIIGLHQTGISSFLGLQRAFMAVGTNPPRLVKDGLYRYMRHPLYTSGLLIIWLIPIMTWNLLALITGLTAYIFIGVIFEERKLVKEFGEEYTEYRSHTPMLVPGLHVPNRKRKS